MLERSVDDQENIKITIKSFGLGGDQNIPLESKKKMSLFLSRALIKQQK